MNVDPEWTDVAGHVVKEQSEKAEKGNQSSYRPMEGDGARVVALGKTAARAVLVVYAKIKSDC